MTRTGILGGTFDPIHSGHILLLRMAAEAFGLDERLLIPSGVSYLKKDRDVSSAEHRLKMCRIAAEEAGDMEVSDMEIKRPGATYTVDTVEELKRLYPEKELYLIFGADCLWQLDSWYRPEKILENAVIIAASRSGEDIRKLQQRAEILMRQLGGRIEVMEFPQIDISSTLIRERAASGLDISLMVPDGVKEYIMEKGLYRREQ
ncbi:MAG: nicotinate-nucleotide adenylyltransferase [Lachnospiraceae bacterium]|nr:nicotinate-nucleotide adenylyltransferase [Lachnospiraceae bacterium]